VIGKHHVVNDDFPHQRLTMNVGCRSILLNQVF